MAETFERQPNDPIDYFSRVLLHQIYKTEQANSVRYFYFNVS